VKEADSIMSRRLRTAVFMPFVALCSLAGLPGMAQTQTWYLDPPHSSAQFSVRHMGISTVRGAFTKVSGTVEDSPDPAKSSVNVTIDASSIDTRVEMRDKDLRGENFFDVAKYPTITFKSTKVEAAGSGKLKVTGDLTMHGVTKEAVLDVDGPTAPFKDPKGKSHRGLSATTTLIRSNFGITADAGMVGDSVAIQLDVELVDQAPGPPRSGPPPTPPPAGK
jgi:polyisoprenoid-binding protein YceI